MPEIKEYHLHPTDLIPNSARPLLHYKNVIPRDPASNQCNPPDVWALFHGNGWNVSWIVRYGRTQPSHFHSRAHETMAVLSGTATIRFGAGDTSDDMEANTWGDAWEAGGVEVEAEAGDVFVIPAGVAHKTYNARPEHELHLLTKGTGHGIGEGDPREIMSEIALSGFTMMGAYNGGDWDFVMSGGDYESSWSVPKPELDPVFGESEKGLRKIWRGSDSAPSTVVANIAKSA